MGRRFCLSMTGLWLEKLLFDRSFLWSFPTVEAAGPTTKPPFWTGTSPFSFFSVKSLLSDAVSHSSFAWSELALQGSGDLCARLGAGRSSSGCAGRWCGSCIAVICCWGGNGPDPFPARAAFSLSCFSLRKRGGLSCCCDRPCRLLLGGGGTLSSLGTGGLIGTTTFSFFLSDRLG